jgi:aminomethyltransferase
MEWITPAALASLPDFNSTLSVLLNKQGGIIDDTIVTKHSANRYYVVTNGGRRDRDVAWITRQVKSWNAQHTSEDTVTFTPMYDQGLVALQGLADIFLHIQ